MAGDPADPDLQKMRRLQPLSSTAHRLPALTRKTAANCPDPSRRIQGSWKHGAGSVSPQPEAFAGQIVGDDPDRLLQRFGDEIDILFGDDQRG